MLISYNYEVAIKFYEYDLFVSMLELTRIVYRLCIFLHTSALAIKSDSFILRRHQCHLYVISSYNMFDRKIPNDNTLMMCKQVLSACLWFVLICIDLCWFVLIIRFSVLHFSVLLSTLELDLHLAFTIHSPVMSCINFDLIRTLFLQERNDRNLRADNLINLRTYVYIPYI